MRKRLYFHDEFLEMPNMKYDWKRIGREIIRAYTRGASAMTLSPLYNIPADSIISFLRRQNVLRTKKQAMVIAGEHGRLIRNPPKASRKCVACKDNYLPTSVNSRACKTCIPNARFSEYFTRYGITKKDWDRILTTQNGVCAICKDLVPTHIDHNHQTGVVRGLLCVVCNTTLGTVERPGWLPSATSYLQNDTGHRTDLNSKYWTNLRRIASVNKHRGCTELPHRSTK